MAIQLNERDHLIFKMIEEHKVLLEKHIAWFISSDEKPVLIRDRLRKLFYLDYLLCHRHNSKLPWWTTPTKPLVYMLSPISKSLIESKEYSLDLYDCEVQRHLLEVANIRMLGLMSQKEGQLKDFQWQTCDPNLKERSLFDAIVSFQTNSEVPNEIPAKAHCLGIINHPQVSKVLAEQLFSSKEIASADLSAVLIVSRDDKHQESLQNLLKRSSPTTQQIPGQVNPTKILFVTHHELYRSGIAKAGLLNAESQGVSFLSPEWSNPNLWPNNFQPIQAFPA